MTGSAVVDAMLRFKGYAVQFTVATKDGAINIYNYSADTDSAMPAYDRTADINSAGYINPGGTFRITTSGPDENGRISCVIINQK